MRKPDAVKVAVALVLALVGITVLYFMFASESLFLIIMAGLLVVGACVGLFLAGSAWYGRRRALPSEEELDELDRDDPRARIAGLRKSFSKGLQQFSSSGKGVYDLPWYLVVGETGAGKTEAIRHSSLGFPPGLHDGLRGIGGEGTLNWWFTNDAVMLDTVGQWLSAEESQGDDALGEWAELSRLLASHRPQSPVNGVVLALSCESLLRDSEPQTKAKAATISRKLAHAARTFGVRFPIFLVVTKCDKLVGFREFFEHLSPEEREQMLGWSNPGRLEEAYDPNAIEEHLRGFFEGLSGSAVELLAPVRAGEAHSGAGLAARADAIYAFPDCLERLVPKLRAYLEAVFLLGEWSTAPLFLRGIFFTSSMQQASVIDQEVHERFGLPDEAPGARGDGDDEDEGHPFFLHDMFVGKVFKERGLVVSAGASQGFRRARQVLPWAFGLAGVSLLILLTWLSSRSLSRDVGDERGYWKAAAEDAQWKTLYGRSCWRPVVVPVEGGGDFDYAGTDAVEVAGRELSTANLLGEIADRVEKPMQVPWMFRFTSRIEGDLGKRRLLAGRALLESSVLFPVIRGSIERMTVESADDWHPEATEALGQLVRLALSADNASGGNDDGLLDLDVLFRYLLLSAPDEYQSYAGSHSAVLGQALRKLYGGRNAGSWPPESLKAIGGELEKALRQGVDSFGAYWDNQMAPGTMSTYFAGVSSLAEAGDGFLAAEEGLHKLIAGSAGEALPRSLVSHNIVTGECERLFALLSSASEEIGRNERLLEPGTLKKAYEATGAATLAGAEEAFKKLRGLTSAAGDAADRESAPAALRLVSGLDRALKARLETLRKRVAAGTVPERADRLDAAVFATVKEQAFARKAERAFENRFATYALAQKQLVKRLDVGGVFELAKDLAALRAAIAECRANVGKRDEPAGAVPLAKEAVKASLFACDLAERGREFVLLKSALDNVRDASGGLEGAVGARAKARGLATEQRPAIPMTGVRERDFDPGYNRTAAAELLAGREALASALGKAGAPGPKALLEREELLNESGALKTAFDGYFLGYLKYWLATVESGLAVGPPAEGGFFGELAKVQPWQANEGIGSLVDIADKALEGFDAAADTVTAARVKSVRRGIETGRGRITSELFLGKCRDVVSRWAGAKDDPDGVRKAILSSTPVDFLQKYTVAGGAVDADVVMRYWDDLTCGSLEQLASAFQAGAAGELARLDALRAFPLAGPERKGLEPPQLLEARRVFDRLRMSPAGLPDGAIGGGARTGVGRLDAALSRLARCDLEPDLGRWLSAADKVLAGLPRAEPFECEVTLLPTSEQKSLLEKGGRTYEASSTVPIWRSIALAQEGRATSNPAKTEQSEAVPLGKLVYPGREVRFDLHKFSGDPPDKTIRASGPWPCLLLLHDHGAERSGGDGRVWNVGLKLKDDVGRQRTLWLRLTFARELPALEDWPRSVVEGGLGGPGTTPAGQGAPPRGGPAPAGPSQQEREQAAQLLAAARTSRQRGDLDDARGKLAAARAADPRNADVTRELDEVNAAIAAKASADDRAERYKEWMAKASGAERAGDLGAAADAYGRAAAFAPKDSTEASASAERCRQELAKRAAPPPGPGPGEAAPKPVPEGPQDAERLAAAAAAVADAGRPRDAWKLISDARKRGQDSPRLKELARRVVRELEPKPSAKGPLGVELCLVRGGTFGMGRDDGEVDERPIRRVTVSSFYIGRLEVSAAQFEGYRKGLAAPAEGVERGSEPVISVSWDEASRFCEHLAGLDQARVVYRLPTEAEWEFAARGPQGRRFPWGNGPVAPANANIAGDADGHARLAPVGSFPAGATPEGVLDMFGNAGEWCRDWYAPYSADDVSDPRGPARGEQRTARGSAYAFTTKDWPATTTRGNAPPNEKLDTIGFRVVRELTEEERDFERLGKDE